MAINISMTNIFRFTNPQVLQNPAAYIIELGQNEMILPSVSNHITADASSGARLGGPGLIKIRPDQSFTMSDEQFGNLVNSSKDGDIAPTDFINSLMYLMGNQTLQVDHDGTVLTVNQVYHFTPA